VEAGENKAIRETQRRGFVLAAAFLGLLTIGYCGSYLGRAAEAPQGAAAERINPNTADAASLMRLPNIGRSRAEAIIEYRQSAGGKAFEKAADMERVKGIGPKTVEGMGPWLEFD